LIEGREIKSIAISHAFVYGKVDVVSSDLAKKAEDKLHRTPYSLVSPKALC
jgi:hypothetical protein